VCITRLIRFWWEENDLGISVFLREEREREREREEEEKRPERVSPTANRGPLSIHNTTTLSLNQNILIPTAFKLNTKKKAKATANKSKYTKKRGKSEC